jgi:hypothetical protein
MPWVSEGYIGHLVFRGLYKESADVLACRAEISVQVNLKISSVMKDYTQFS